MNFEQLAALIQNTHQASHGSEATLIGISGINLSGKSYVARRIGCLLCARGMRVAFVSADSWVDLPTVRFGCNTTPRHYYEHAMRLDSLFADLLLPLKSKRSITVTTKLLTRTGDAYEERTISHKQVDVILVDGNYLFKRPYQPLFDLALWVDCTVETALERFTARNADDVEWFSLVYMPAQAIHMADDGPIDATHYTVNNDWRIPRGLRRVLSNRGALACTA